jgi:hypothetical protein
MENNLQQIVEKYRDSKSKQYVYLCKENPGYIMFNCGIEAEICQEILNEDLTIEQIKDKEIEAMEKYKTMKGPNGWFTASKMYRIIIDEYEKSLGI